MNNIYFILILNVLFCNTSLLTYLDAIIYKGKYDDLISIEESDKKLDEYTFYEGLIEIDGDKSKEKLIEFYNSKSSLYKDIAAIKIAEYYYANGLYIQSSDWYKKIALDYYYYQAMIKY